MPGSIHLHLLASFRKRGPTLIKVNPSAVLKTPPTFPFDLTLKSFFVAA